MLLGPALDPNDPTTAMLMAGSENIPMPFDYAGEYGTKPRGFSQSFDGMSTTLAPSVLDMSSQLSQTFGSQTQMGLTTASASNAARQLGLDENLLDLTKGSHQSFMSGHSSGDSGSVTPGMDGGWDAFINDATWADHPT